MKKRIVSLLCLLAMLCSVFALSACQAAKDKTAPAYVTLDINPSIELTTDADGKVTSVYAANEDARILLYNEESLIGVDLNTATEKIVALAVEHGYLDKDNKVIGTSVISDDEEATADMLEKLNVKVTESAEALGLSVTTTAEGAYSLIRELEAFKAAHPDNAAVQSLTAAEYKLICAATESGDLSVEAAVAMEREALIAKANAAHQEAKAFATDAYEMAKRQAGAIYDKAVGAALDSVYTTYYLTHAMSHPTTVYYGPVYQMYRSSARVFDGVADAFEFATTVANEPLTEAQIDSVQAIFNLAEDELDKLKNADNEITLQSVMAYADKTFKNSPAGAELEQMKTDLSTALSTIEADVTAAIEEAYGPQIEAAITEIEALVAAQKNAIASIPVVGQQITTYAEDLARIVGTLKTIMEDGNVSVAELRTAAAEMNTKAAEMLTKIEADLSESELASINELKTAAEQTASAAKATLEQALATAEQNARNDLAAKKAARQGSTAA